MAWETTYWPEERIVHACTSLLEQPPRQACAVPSTFICS